MNGKLDLGKVSLDILRRSVLPYMPLHKGLTLDSTTLEISGRTMISHNSAIGVPLATLGFFAFHYSASNVAVSFARPEYITVGIYLPPESKEEDLKIIAKGLGEEARRYGVRVVAGHTGTYKGISLPLVSVTCLGKEVRRPDPPCPGDLVLVIGYVGGEAVWLKSISEGSTSQDDDSWKRLTPLPPSLRLMETDGVKLMHDVSEGGVAGALYEVAENISLKLDVRSDLMPYHRDSEKLTEDLMRVPSYGALITIISEEVLDRVSKLCEDIGYPCSAVGRVKEGSGAYINGFRIEGIKRTELDEIYGLSKSDEILERLNRALMELERHPKISKLIPEVGTNIVYARSYAKSPSDIAGLSGRVIVSLGGPRVCGETTYGGSKHLASVILEAMKLDPEIRAAINIKGEEEIAKVLESMGLKVCRLPPVRTEDVCPVATFIRNSKELFQAYYHPGSYGIEPSIVILSRNPEELLSIIIRVSEHV